MVTVKPTEFFERHDAAVARAKQLKLAGWTVRVGQMRRKDGKDWYVSIYRRTFKKALVPAVSSLGDLRYKATQDPRYARLLRIGASNLGGPSSDGPDTPTNLNGAYRWLELNAMETDERGVVDEVNFCRDLIDEGGI